MWREHKPGEDPAIDEIVARRFGPNYPKPCNRPDVTMCSMWTCQVNNRCMEWPSCRKHIHDEAHKP